MDKATIESLDREWSPPDPSKTRKLKVILPQFYAALAICAVNLSYNIFEHTMQIVIVTTELRFNSLISVDNLVVCSVITWIGLLLGGILAQIVGGRTIVILAGVCSVLGWITFGWISSAAVLQWTIYIVALMKGMMQAPAYVYLAEISQPNMRNAIMATICLSSNIAPIYLNLAGIGPSKASACINVVFALFGVIVMTFLPDSPYWLANKGRYHGVESSLAWFRGKTTIEHVKPESKLIIRHAQNSPSAWRVFGQKSLRLAVLIVCSVFLANAFVRIFYFAHLSQVHSMITMKYRDSIMLIWSISTVYVSIFFVSIVAVLGKRTMILISLFAGNMALIAASSAGYLSENNIANKDSYSWFLLICVAIESFSRITGVVSVPLMLNGEIFPSKLRNFGAGFGLFFEHALFTVANNLYLVYFDSVQGASMFLAVASTIGFFALLWLFPRNDNKSLVEIERSCTSISELKRKK